jgi:hypothetical protein
MRYDSAKLCAHSLDEYIVVDFLGSEFRLNAGSNPARAITQIASGNLHAVASFPLQPHQLVAQERAPSFP